MNNAIVYEKSIKLPVIPLKLLYSLPGKCMGVPAYRDGELKASQKAADIGEIFLVGQKDESKNSFSTEDLYPIGIVANVLRINHVFENVYQVFSEGIQRARLDRFYTDEDGTWMAEVTPITIDETKLSEDERKLLDGYAQEISDTIKDFWRVIYGDDSEEVIDDRCKEAEDLLSESYDEIADDGACFAQLKFEAGQKVLQTVDLDERMKVVLQKMKEHLEEEKREGNRKKEFLDFEKNSETEPDKEEVFSE